MKKRLVKHCFNMVEIALALAVLAIGMSSILVLFPVGINANKSAIADNNLADIGEYLMGYLRAGCAAEWAAVAKNPTESLFFSSKIPVGYDASLGADGIDLSNYNEHNSGKITDNLYRLNGDSNAVFLYQQMTGDIVDFAAVVRVWQEESSFYGLDASSYKIVEGSGDESSGERYKLDESSFKKVTIKSGEPIENYARVLCIEISWPAQAPDSQRERRLFRQEIFNEAFRFSESGTGD